MGIKAQSLIRHDGSLVMSINTQWRKHRAEIAALSRDRKPDDPELIAARRNLYIAQFERYALLATENAPLTVAQAHRICRIIQRGARG